MRHGELLAPKADYSFQEGDQVAVVGNQQERNEFKRIAGV
jgi:CPA2 family monovalent cation:H+ antiporter-2